MNQPIQPYPNPFQQEEEEGLDLRQYLFLFLGNWYWLALGLALGIAAAWLQLRYATPIYNVKASILINEQREKGLSTDIIAEDLGLKPTADINNELRVLKSTDLLEEVVDSLGLNITYFAEGNIKTSEMYGDKRRVVLAEIDPVNEAYGRKLAFETRPDNTFALIQGQEDTLIQRFDEPFMLGGVSYRIDQADPLLRPGTEMYILIESPEKAARTYASKLDLKADYNSNVIDMSINDAVPERAVDLMNTLAKTYNRNVIEEKNTAGRQTLAFIDERLRFITEELYDVEKEVEGFRKDNRLPVGVSERASSFLAQMEAADAQLMELQLKLDIISQMERFVRADSNQYKALPLASQVLEGTLSGLVGQYNELIFKRDQLMEAATTRNPGVATFNEQLSHLRNTILESIGTMKRELQQRKAQIEERLQPIERQIRAIPTNERQLLQIMRQQQIKEQLFLYLLQKREETAISIAAQTANARLLDAPVKTGIVSPDRQRIYLMFILLGLGLPAGIIFLRDYFDNKIYSKQDIQRLTGAPFLGMISASSKEDRVVVRRGSRSAVAEMFRMLRTNLSYLSGGQPEDKVTLVTSSISGEGKSFITINLGISEALAGKKTILLGFDLRKPRLAKYLTGQTASVGLTNYLVGQAALEDVIQPVPGEQNIDFIGCGPIPPNPAELIMSPATKELFQKLRETYDCIVVDTAPLVLVTDALLLAGLADRSIIVTHFGKTNKQLLSVIDEAYQQQKLPKLGIVLNGVQRRRGYGYGYGGYGGYGYGYGYGYGSGYYDDEKKQKKK